YLWLDNTNKTTTKVPTGGEVAFPLATAPYNVHTLGARYTGDKNHVLWDVEGMVQWGERGKEDIMAGASTVGAGYNFHCLPMNPTGTSGKDVGNELDLVANIHLGPHSDVFVGWSKLWAGDFITTTGNGRNPELWYFMYNVRW